MIGSVLVTLCGVTPALGRLGGGISPAGIAEAVGAAVVYTVHILYGDRIGTAGVPPVALTGLVSLSAAGAADDTGAV